MNERQTIESRLRRKEQEIQSLEEKIKNAKIYAKALRDILKMLDEGGESQSPEPTLRPGSTVAQARDAILSRGIPMHMSDLLEAIGKPHTREARASLGSSLSAYVRRKEIFVRTAPNTFGLGELEHNGDEEQQSSEPPTGFGRLPPSSKLRPIPDEDDEIPF